MASPELSQGKEAVKVGVIQTNVDWEIAWAGISSRSVKMDRFVEEAVWDQIRLSIASIEDQPDSVDILLLPELSVPQGRIKELTKIAMRLRTILIAGIDYSLDAASGSVRNEALAFIPRYWAKGAGAKKCEILSIGKTYPAPLENEVFQTLGLTFNADPTFWIFESKELGNFGVSICYDLMDLERAALYRRRIQHLFVIAYNKDITSFYHLAEALSRSLYCNVVICNSGFFGGSVAISPKYLPWERTIYRHEGNSLVTAQVIELPVAGLQRAWSGNDLSLKMLEKSKQFKSAPPGFFSNKPIKPKMWDIK